MKIPLERLPVHSFKAKTLRNFAHSHTVNRSWRTLSTNHLGPNVTLHLIDKTRVE